MTSNNIRELKKLEKDMLLARECNDLDREEELLNQMDTVWYKLKWWERWVLNGRHR